MGLDITAYSDIEFVQSLGDTSPNQADEFYSLGYTRIYENDPAFTERGDGLEPGWYKRDGSMGFRAGSYGGYNMRRRSLAQAVFAVEPEEIWKDPDTYTHNSVSLLIHFTDCDGFIGPVTSKKIYDDLIQIPEVAISQWELNEYDFLSNFTAAFKLASQNGVVRFS